jgi:hypothetical protein
MSKIAAKITTAEEEEEEQNLTFDFDTLFEDLDRDQLKLAVQLLLLYTFSPSDVHFDTPEMRLKTQGVDKIFFNSELFSFLSPEIRFPTVSKPITGSPTVSIPGALIKNFIISYIDPNFKPSANFIPSYVKPNALQYTLQWWRAQPKEFRERTEKLAGMVKAKAYGHKEYNI